MTDQELRKKADDFHQKVESLDKPEKAMLQDIWAERRSFFEHILGVRW